MIHELGFFCVVHEGTLEFEEQIIIQVKPDFLETRFDNFQADKPEVIVYLDAIVGEYPDIFDALDFHEQQCGVPGIVGSRVQATKVDFTPFDKIGRKEFHPFILATGRNISSIKYGIWASPTAILGVVEGG
jgi:hypothetical protein